MRSGVTPRPGTRRATMHRNGNGPMVLSGLILAVCLVMVCALSLVFGSRSVSPSDILHALSASSDDIAVSAIRLRIPRTVLGLLVGAGLGVAGTLMQGISRNPLADPSILGFNTGAALAIGCSIAFFSLSTPAQYVWVGLLGSATTALVVWAIGSLGPSGPSPLRLTLAGVVISSVLGSLTSAILLPRINVISSYRFWQVGGISGARFDLMMPVLPLLALGLILAFCLTPGINALTLGDQMAEGLGMHVGRVRSLAWLAAILLCASCTALAGPIGFVGLVVPHVARLLIGPDYRRIMALSILIGPLLVVGADVVGRIITRPSDVEVGIVTALIGAPVFVILAGRRRTAEV